MGYDLETLGIEASYFVKRISKYFPNLFVTVS